MVTDTRGRILLNAVYQIFLYSLPSLKMGGPKGGSRYCGKEKELGNGESLCCLSSNPVNSLLQDFQGVNLGISRYGSCPFEVNSGFQKAVRPFHILLPTFLVPK